VNPFSEQVHHNRSARSRWRCRPSAGGRIGPRLALLEVAGGLVIVLLGAKILVEHLAR
jgi:hypothetical protein